MSLPHTHAQMKQLLQANSQTWRNSESMPNVFARSTPEKDRDKDREKDRDKARTSVAKGVQRQLLLEHEERELAEAAMHQDLQRRLEDTRDRVVRVEAQLQETIARMESRLRARDQDLAELREELRMSQPTARSWAPEVAAGMAGIGGGAPEEAGPGLGALAADLADLRRSMTAEVSEQVRRHEEVSAGLTANLTVLEEHLQEGLQRLREMQGEQLSESSDLRRRLGHLEAHIREAPDAAGKGGQSGEQRAEDGLEGSPASTDGGHCFFSPGSASSRRSSGRFGGSLLDTLEAVQECVEADEDPTAESDASLRAPRLSIMKGGDFESSPGCSSIVTPVRRHSSGDLAEAVRHGSEQRQEQESPDHLPPEVPAGLAGHLTVLEEHLQEGLQRLREMQGEQFSESIDLRRRLGQLEAHIREALDATGKGGQSGEQRAEDGLEAAATSLALAGPSGPSGPLHARSSEDRPSVDCGPAAVPSVAAEVAAARPAAAGVEELAEATSALAGRMQALEGQMEVDDRRLEDLQSGLSVEIEAVRDLVEAELSRSAVESAALNARLAALERRTESGEGLLGRDQEKQRSQIAELRDRVESLVSQVGTEQSAEKEQLSLAQRATALGERVQALETRLQDGLHELQEGQEAELALLRSRVEVVEGGQNARPPEQCPEATSLERARGGAAPGVAVAQPSEADDLDIEFEESMKKMTSESREECSESTEQQAAMSEASRAKGGPRSTRPPPVAALQLPAAGSHADERPSGSETRRALEALRGRLQAEAEGLREQLEVHAERCDEQMRGFREERAAEESRLLQRLEEAAAAGGRGEELAQATMCLHDEEATRSTAQRALLEGEQRRLAAEAAALWQRLEALEAAESRGRQALAVEVEGSVEVAAGRQAFARAFGGVAAGVEAEAEAPAAPRLAVEALLQAEGRGDVERELEAVQDRIEALLGEQGQQLVRVEDHQEALECLQGQVGVLETCLEENDGKLTEIQTTLLQARLEGLVAMDERIKSLEGQIQATSRKLSEAQLAEPTAHSSELSQRLAALERSFEELEVAGPTEEEVQCPEGASPKSETLPIGPNVSFTESWTPSFRFMSHRAPGPEESTLPRAQQVYPAVEEESLVLAGGQPTNSEDASSSSCSASVEPLAPQQPMLLHKDASSSSSCSAGADPLQDLRRYLDERLRKLQSAQQDHSTDTAELRRRVDEVAQGIALVGHRPSPAKSAQEVADGGEAHLASSVDERLQVLEGKCTTMLNLLLKL